MKPVMRILSIVAVLLSGAKVQGQVKPDIKSVIDNAVEKAKQNALNHRIRWDSVQNDMYQKAENATSIKDLRESLQTLLIALNDRHAKFIDLTTNTEIATHPQYQDPENPAKPRADNSNEKFDYKLLNNEVGYLKIVATPGANIQEEAAIIRAAVDSLSKREVLQWIVDLRYCNGGNLNSISAGTGPLIGEGFVGGVVDTREKVKKLFEIHNGKFYDDKLLAADFPCSKDMRDSKVAVLISDNTSDAGEILAIMMKGRKNTRFFGEATAGKIANIATISICDGLSMTVSKSLYTDRKGNVYKDRVIPETVVAFSPATNLINDNTIVEAISWLNTTMVQPNTAVALVTSASKK
jgi:C-terminal processing protease CtpA/Prc